MPRAPAKKKPVRAPLAADAILEAALAILDAEGFDRLTVRRLSAELGVSPMALYWHVDGKAALLGRLVDHVVGAYGVTDHPRDDPRAFLQETFRRMRQGLVDHPGLLPLIARPDGVGTHAHAVMHDVLGVLRGVGLSTRASFDAYFLLASFTIGSVTVDHAATTTGAPGRRGDAFDRGIARLVDLVLPKAR